MAFLRVAVDAVLRSLKESVDTMQTVRERFGALLKSIDLTEMSRDTRKSHRKRLEGKSAECTED